MASLEELYERFLNNSCTEEELLVLLQHFELSEYSQLTNALVEKELAKNQLKIKDTTEIDAILERNRSKIKSTLFTSQKKTYPLWRYLGIASSFILISLFALYINDTRSKRAEMEISHTDIEPGTNRAVLTLDDGKSFDLLDTSEGIQTSTTGITYSDGTSITDSKNVKFASLTVPRKGQYQVTLSDGTKVWLNAESSLRYPVTFTDKERIVELQGEGYFEVAHDKSRSFKVKSARQIVQVLGTIFNIKAYSDELSTTTTLVSGSVKLTVGDLSETILNPNQQAVASDSGFEVNQVDVMQYKAWKDGEFRFRASSLPEVIKQLERWYDLEVDYNTIPKNIKVNVSIARDKKLSSVLKVLSEISGITFKVQERRLIMTQ